MAALSMFHSLNTTTVHQIKPAPKPRSLQPCRSHLRSGPSSGGEDPKKVKPERKQGNQRLGLIQKLSKGLQEMLGPRQKGDWKDLVLMSFSFAVYVYISQRIVCAYCAWISMLKHY